MAKTTLILGNSFFQKKMRICFWKNSRLLSKADWFPLKKFNFSMAVFQTSMKMLKNPYKVMAVKKIKK